MNLTKLYSILERLTTKRVILVLFVVAHLVLLLMMLFTFPRINAQLETEAFDLKATGYTVEEATAMLQKLDQATINLYLFPQLFLLDVLYPFLLALLLSTLIIRLSGLIKMRAHPLLSHLYLLPFLAMALDYAENVSIALMITNTSQISAGTIQTASLFTQLKSGITTICWLVVIILFFVWLVNRKRSSAEAN
ncbi:hypothetical protein SAMN04488029_0088 [Reichenbachiella faecimaris]|uniref:Uncharacterized protein n=1 Tax=Reichenbachiella faecimaris TaxID=692418 RepID=A0A1W2G586_REIFA|nr:hypothetical protein [Reichenbachiella faecimaris]SMD31751.1 hypothetical protein SAMN04488029_0088 [Reichenbachiella faecimaris]